MALAGFCRGGARAEKKETPTVDGAADHGGAITSPDLPEINHESTAFICPVGHLASLPALRSLDLESNLVVTRFHDHFEVRRTVALETLIHDGHRRGS